MIFVKGPPYKTITEFMNDSASDVYWHDMVMSAVEVLRKPPFVIQNAVQRGLVCPAKELP